MNRDKCIILTTMIAILVAVAGCEYQDGDRVTVNTKITVPERYEAHSQVTVKDTFHFGFDLRNSPQEDARQYIPFIKYLEKKTGYSFNIHFTPADKNIVDELGENVIQFAAIGSGSYILADHKYDVCPLVRGINHAGKAEYKSVFVVLPDSPIDTIQDLRGKRIAFGSDTSTQGYLIPRIILEDNGLALNDLKSYVFTGSHLNCANEVLAKHADVCGIQDTMGYDLAKKGLLRIIYESDYFPSSGIVCNKKVLPEVREKVKQALLDFQPKTRDSANLYNWDKTEMPNGFVSASEEDYEIMHNWTNKFGLLPEH